MILGEPAAAATGSPFYNVSTDIVSWRFLLMTGYHDRTGPGSELCRF